MESKNSNKRSNLSTFMDILSFSKRYRFWIIISIISALVFAACEIYSVELIKQLVDMFTIGAGKSITNIVIIMVLVILVGLVCKYFIKYSSGKLGTGIVFDIRNKTINILGVIKIAEVEKGHSGDLVSKLSNNLSAVENFLTNDFTNYIYIPLKVFLAFVFLAFINWKLLIVSFVSTPIALYLTNVLSRPMGEFSEKYYDQLGKANCISSDGIKGMGIVKAFNLKEVFRDKYRDILEKAFKQGMKIEIRNQAILPIIIITYELPYILCAIFGGYMAVNGQIQPGSLIAFIQLLRLLIGPSTQLPNLISNYRNTMGAAKSLFEILESPTECRSGRVRTLENNEPVIEFQNISFSYDGEEKVLNDISFELHKGEKIAIVGHSGCGKSTIMNLICGFYQPSAGCIKLYGNDMSDLSISFAREQFSLVPQESYLIPGTIEENIGYGKLFADKEEIIEAARIANIHDSIMEMPEGYNTRIVEGGSNLSGGQKQRIAIARAILKDAGIILLDESTSAMDYHSEKIIRDAIQSSLKDKSMIVIAHRLSLIKNVDRIIVLGEGKIIDSGTHNELINTCTVYRDLYLDQSNSEKEESLELLEMEG